MKEFKTIDEQIALLRSRGLVIPDENKAYLYLLTNNYYNIINGYSKYFPMDEDNYTAGTTFDEVWHLYLFDKELKQAFFEAILNAESHLRAVFAYRFAEIFPSPSYAYLHTDCYDNSKILSVGSTISRISGLINYQKGIPGTSIRHYFHQYHNVPIWVLVNHMDFGTLRYMLSSVQSDLQNAVAKDMRHFIDAHIPGAKKFDPETMLSFLANINDVRNVCAHNNRLIDFKCRRDSRYWTPLHAQYSITKDSDRRTVYMVFLSLQCFLTATEYSTLNNAIRKRMNRLGNCLVSISLDDVLSLLGFPPNWNRNPKLPQV